MIEVYIYLKRNEVRVVDRNTQKTNVYFNASFNKDENVYEIFEWGETENGFVPNKYLEFLPVSRTRIIMKH